jgi:hypothetical protein
MADGLWCHGRSPEVSVVTSDTSNHAHSCAGRRDIEPGDTPDSAAVVVISNRWRSNSGPTAAIGRRPAHVLPDRERVVVGVVGDVKQLGLDSTAGVATLYWPVSQVGDSAQGPWRPFGLSLAVRTTVVPETLTNAVTSAVALANSNIPVDNVITLEDFVGDTLTQRRFNMQLLTIFGLLALVLCTIGIYSVLAYSVKRRMREIGVRLALGASMRDVAALVVLQGMKPTMAGVGIGVLAALGLGQIASSLVYGVSSHDTATFLAVTVALVLVSFAASLVPALPAKRVEPLAVPREE